MTATVYRARWVLPVSGSPIADGAVRVGRDGVIERVGPAADVPTHGARLTDLGEVALTAGLINVHAHPELTLLRGQLENEAFAPWIERVIELKYHTLGPEAIRASTWLGVAECIAAGVTCIAAPDDAGFLQEALTETGVRGRVYREVFGPVPAEAETALVGLEAKIEAMRRLASERVEIGIAPHAPYTIAPQLFSLLAEYARAEALPVTVHVAESEAEERFVRFGLGPLADRLLERGIELEAMGQSPVASLAATGILETHPLLVHCVHVDEADVLRIADTGSSIAHCPISNAKFGHGIAPLLFFLELGIGVGLGSDSVASNNRVDILEEARAAVLMQRATYRAAGVLSADECLRLATLEGARALGIADRVGSLEAGKAADMTAIRLDVPSTTPVGDPVAALIHEARGIDVVLTMVGGRVLSADGEFKTLAFGELSEALRKATT